MTEPTAYNGFYRKRLQINFEGSGRTHQSFKSECDINTILKRYEKTGEISHEANGRPKYGDFTNAADYMTACNAIIEAKQTFAALPARIRERMHNDPGELLDFMSDPDNLDEAIQLGLILEPEKPPTETVAKPPETPATETIPEGTS